jgi:anti-sigma factor RsiW
MPQLSPACDRVRGQLSLELDGELSQLERAMVAAHLERCDRCRAFRDGVVAITGALREAPLERLEHAVILPSRSRSRRRARFATAQVAAAAASIAVALGFGLNASGVVDSAGLDSRSTTRPAYLDSADYDLRIIDHVRNTRLAQRISRAV